MSKSDGCRREAALNLSSYTTRDIEAYLQEIYGVDVSPSLISYITEAVMEEMKIWQSRSLDEVYPTPYMDAMRVKVSDGGPKRLCHEFRHDDESGNYNPSSPGPCRVQLPDRCQRAAVSTGKTGEG